MRSWLVRGLIGLLSLGVFALLTVPAQVESGSGAICYLSLDTSAAPGVMGLNNGDIPPNCANWHELYPNYCAPSHQSGYEDNGDGCVSVCDMIQLDGVDWHITWVGPTYHLLCLDNDIESDYEPNQGPHDPASPVCENWQEIWPNFGNLGHVDDHMDHDGSGTITICDEVVLDGLLYHVQDIRLNIIIEEPTPTQDSTWGKIKQRFTSLFH